MKCRFTGRTQSDYQNMKIRAKRFDLNSNVQQFCMAKCGCLMCDTDLIFMQFSMFYWIYRFFESILLIG